VGGAALFAAWGEPARPGFPLWGNGKGDSTFLAAAGAFPCSHRRFALLPFALFKGASAPVPVWVLILNGCCHLRIELNRLVPEASVPPRPRSHPNPAIGLTKLYFKSLRQLSPWPDCFSAARIPRRSPTDGAAGSPAFSPPPRSLFSLRSFRRDLPASCPTASDPCPAPAPP